MTIIFYISFKMLHFVGWKSLEEIYYCFWLIPVAHLVRIMHLKGNRTPWGYVIKRK